MRATRAEWLYLLGGNPGAVRDKAEFHDDDCPIIVDHQSSAASPCWIWTASRTSHGYGRVLLRGVKVMAHRITYSARYQPDLELRPGLRPAFVLDHAVGCPRSCVNPEHLTPATTRENVYRGRMSMQGAHASPLVGAHWDTRDKLWRSSIRLGTRINVYLGCFRSDREAAGAYDAACIALGHAAPNCERGAIAPPDPARVRDAAQRITTAIKAAGCTSPAVSVSGSGSGAPAVEPDPDCSQGVGR